MRIIGHEKIISFLDNSIKNNRLVHAYLFVGPEHIGKTRVAMEFARKLLGCESNCDIKKTELEQLAGILNHPDFIFAERERDEKTDKFAKNISVNQIRNLIKRLNLSSFLNSHKVALIPKIEDLSIGGANSLLKILEEPKGKTVIILCAECLENLLATIVSRCQILNFFPVKKEDIYQSLIKNNITENEAEKYSRLSFGLPGVALNFFQNKESFKIYQTEIEKCYDLINGSLVDNFMELEDYFSKKISPQDRIINLNKILWIWSSLFRDVLYIKEGCDENISNYFIKDRLKKISLKLSNLQILDILKSIIKTREYFLNNVNPRLAFENLVLKF